MTVSIPGYRDFELLGRGGFAAVYQARQEAYDRLVAVKVLDVGISDEELRRRVDRERAAAGRLTGHPNIVTVLDSGFLDDGRPFLAMALCPGGSVADQLARHGPLPVADVLRIGIKIGGALHTAHQHDLVHRDVKPENVLVTGYGEPALSDFGIATIADQRALTRSTQAYTPNHAPPEVLRGQRATAASDVYSLGSTLYQLLAGRAPFAPEAAAGLAAFVDSVLNQEAPSPARSDLPASLTQVLRQAMAKDPADRFGSAHALAQALQQVQRELGLQVDDIPVLPAGAAGGSGPLVGAAGQAPPGADETIRPPAPPLSAAPLSGPATVLGGRSQDAAPPPPPLATPDQHHSGRRLLLVAGLVAILVLAGGGAVFAVTGGIAGLGGGSGGGSGESSAPATPPASANPDETPDGTAGPDGGDQPAPAPPGPEVTSLEVSGAECNLPQFAGGWRGVVTISWEAVRADNVQLFLPTTGAHAGGYDEVRGSDTFDVECEPGGEFQVRVVAQQGARQGGHRDATGTWPGGTPVITSFQISNIECPATAPGQASVGHFTVDWTSEGADEVWIYWHGESAFTGYFQGPNGGDRIAATCRLGQSFMLRAEARRDGEPGGTRDQTATWPG